MVNAGSDERLVGIASQNDRVVALLADAAKPRREDIPLSGAVPAVASPA